MFILNEPVNTEHALSHQSKCYRLNFIYKLCLPSGRYRGERKPSRWVGTDRGGFPSTSFLRMDIGLTEAANLEFITILSVNSHNYN